MSKLSVSISDLSSKDYNAFLQIIDYLDGKSLVELCYSKNTLIIDICKTEPYMSRVNRYKDILKRRKEYESYYHDALYKEFMNSDIPTRLYLYYYYYLTHEDIEQLPDNYMNIPKEEVDKIISGLFYTHYQLHDIIEYFSSQYDTYVEYAQEFYDDYYGSLNIYLTPDPITGEYFFEQQEDLSSLIDAIKRVVKPTWLIDSKEIVDPSSVDDFIYKSKEYQFEDIDEAISAIDEIKSLYFE